MFLQCVVSDNVRVSLCPSQKSHTYVIAVRGLDGHDAGTNGIVLHDVSPVVGLTELRSVHVPVDGDEHHRLRALFWVGTVVNLDSQLQRQQ